MKSDSAWQRELVTLIQFASKDTSTLQALLNDLLSPEEIRSIACRWQIIKQLSRHTPHREIASHLHTSIATVTRGSRMLSHPTGGFRRVLHMIHTTKNPTGLVKAWRKQLME